MDTKVTQSDSEMTAEEWQLWKVTPKYTKTTTTSILSDPKMLPSEAQRFNEYENMNECDRVQEWISMAFHGYHRSPNL